MWDQARGHLRVLTARWPVSCDSLAELQQLHYTEKQCLPVGSSWPSDTSGQMLSELPALLT